MHLAFPAHDGVGFHRPAIRVQYVTLSLWVWLRLHSRLSEAGIVGHPCRILLIRMVLSPLSRLVLQSPESRACSPSSSQPVRESRNPRSHSDNGVEGASGPEGPTLRTQGNSCNHAERADWKEILKKEIESESEMESERERERD